MTNKIKNITFVNIPIINSTAFFITNNLHYSARQLYTVRIVQTYAMARNVFSFSPPLDKIVLKFPVSILYSSYLPSSQLLPRGDVLVRYCYAVICALKVFFLPIFSSSLFYERIQRSIGTWTNIACTACIWLVVIPCQTIVNKLREREALLQLQLQGYLDSYQFAKLLQLIL